MKWLDEDIAKCIDLLGQDCETVGDDMVWEQSVRIAILLRFITAANLGWSPPFDLGEAHETKDAVIDMLPLGPDVTRPKRSLISTE